ncbi:rhamnosyltransferase [Burkholderia pseudomallei]|nr:rhamnosyltransferase [Burkholderia pseudomallei]
MTTLGALVILYYPTDEQLSGLEALARAVQPHRVQRVHIPLRERDVRAAGGADVADAAEAGRAHAG